MKFAIIAAGEGSRLTEEGVKQPKPLVSINGTAMIDRLIRIFMDNEATSIAVIINKEQIETQKHLAELQKKYPLEVIIKSTPGSMHSFYELMPLLKNDKFCLTTVDTVFSEVEFTAYIQSFEASDDDGFMAVTDFIDDEKPLYISTSNSLDITGYHDIKTDNCDYISGGVYCLSPSCLDVLQSCMDKGYTRMREFQRALVEDGKILKAYPFYKILDVDHAEDIKKAEKFLLEPHPIIGIKRGEKFSPNKANSDALIFNQVKKNLEIKGYPVKAYSEQQFIDQPMYSSMVFTMAREEMTLSILDILEKEGATIINPTQGTRNTKRLVMTLKLLTSGIPSPQMGILHPQIPVKKQQIPAFPFWIKRADEHAQVKEDVSYIQTIEEAESVLENFKERGIELAIVNEHIEGDLVKFYGVADSDFFYWCYPSSNVNSKFGLEAINGEAKGYSFSEDTLKKYCQTASEKMELPIYGGDCIISSEGEISIIDFNDWPSFAPCCNEAAEAIANLIVKKIKHGKQS